MSRLWSLNLACHSPMRRSSASEGWLGADPAPFLRSFRAADASVFWASICATSFASSWAFWIARCRCSSCCAAAAWARCLLASRCTMKQNWNKVFPSSHKQRKRKPGKCAAWKSSIPMRICGMEHDLIQKPWAPEEAKRPLLKALLKCGRLLSCQLPRSRLWLSQLLAAPLQLRMRVDWDPTLEEGLCLNWQPRQLWVVLWWLSGFTNHVLFWGLDLRLGACKIRTSLLLEGQLSKSWVNIESDIFAIRKELFQHQGCMLPRLSLCAFHVLTTAFHTLPQSFVTDCAHWFSALVAETPRWQPA